MCAAVALAVLAGGCARRQAPHDVRGVFLIVVDTVRPDRLACYGVEGYTTPAIDGLAASGVRFENAQSPASWTLPAMGALLTSRYPTQLGLVERPPDSARTFGWREKRAQVRYTLPDGVTTLARRLDDAGYYPVAFVNQPFINAGSGFMQGFAAWCYPTGEDSIAWHDPTVPMPSLVYPPGADLGNADTPIVDAFGAWLAQNADRRPFAWVHLLRPHWPYNPLRDHLPPALQQAPPESVSALVRYEAEIREADDEVGALLQAIDAHVGLAHALVILVSDHGEEFFDHGMYEHGHSLHQEILHVPLILAGPGLAPGTTVVPRAGTIDLLPTVLDLVGRPDLTPATCEGRSLRALIDGHGSTDTVYSEGMLYGSTERSLIAGDDKLMFDAQGEPHYRLYDVSRDPLERHDIRATVPEQAARMERALTAHGARMVDDYAVLVGPKSATVDPETERILRAMRALGYVND
jgi:arylsulfatase A-like enzyme